MATRIEWTRLARGLEGVKLAIRLSLGSIGTTTAGRPRRGKRVRKHDRTVYTIDPSFMTDIERRKNLVYLNYVRNQLR